VKIELSSPSGRQNAPQLCDVHAGTLPALLKKFKMSAVTKVFSPERCTTNLAGLLAVCMSSGV
jgi:hypothetical protein